VRRSGGPPTVLGEPVAMRDAEDRIFGLVLMNDWCEQNNEGVHEWVGAGVGAGLVAGLAP